MRPMHARSAYARPALLLTALLVALPAGPPVRAADAPALRVTLLGTGNPRPAIERFGPSALVEAGPHTILIDAGRGASIRLFQIGRARLLSGIDRILLTHLHSDHVVGLADLWLTGWIFGRRRPLAISGPPGTAAMVGHLERAYEFDVKMRRDADERFPAAGIRTAARDIEPGVILERGGLKITAFAVDHRPVAPAFGYRIEYRGRSVVFSGDTRPARAVVEHSRGADLLVHEVLSPEVERRLSLVHDPEATRRIIDHHTTPEEAGRIFAAAGPRLAVYSHIVPSPATPEDLLPPTRRTYEGRVVVGHDLMTISIGDEIVVGEREIQGD